MATGQPQTIGGRLFSQVQGLFESSEAASPFAIAQIRRDAEKLQGAEPVEASIVKSAIAAYHWDADEANYWVNNAVSLRKTAVNFKNAAVTLCAINDFNGARKYSLLAASLAPSDPDTILKAIDTLSLGGYLSEAVELGAPLVGRDKLVSSAIKEITDILEAASEVGTSEERIRAELQLAARVATERKVRIMGAELHAIQDPDGGISIFVPLSIRAEWQMEMQLEDAFAACLAEDADWNPLKLSVEFKAS